MSVVEEIFSDISPLESIDKIELVEKILVSLHPIDREIEAIWADEAEDRLDAYEKGMLSAVSAKDVFEKYQK